MALNSKEFTTELLNLITNFGKVGVFKINILKSIVFPHYFNEQLKNQTEKIIPFITASEILSKTGKTMCKNTVKTIKY